MKRIDFVGIGFCSNDHLCRIPELVLDSKVEMLEHEIQGGGPCGGAVVAAARLGVTAAMVGTTGSDADGDMIVRDFRAEGVDVSHFRQNPGECSPIAYCLITPDGRRTVAWSRQNLSDFPPDELPEDLIANAKIVHFDGHQIKAALRAAELAKRNGVMTCFDAGLVRPGTDELLELCDVVITSELFARKYTGETDFTSALRKLDNGRRITGVTMGKEGSMLLVDGRLIVQEAYNPGTIIDTTGAGDSFHGAFEVRYMETGNAVESMRFAAVFAALKCRRLGARAGMPSRTEVETALKTWR